MNAEQNEMLTRVGPGTPGGEWLRRYWWPVGFDELIQKTPVVVRHLGEDFVLFRDGAGTIGMLEAACAHRQASLEHGRVEERGIRCCYHGWLFAPSGQCLEMPAEPPESTFPAKVRQRAAAIAIVAGMVFAYIGPDPAPSFPRYDLLFLDNCDRAIWAGNDLCNWVQRAENGVDPYHSMALHAPVYPSTALKRPEVNYTQTWYGFRNESGYPNGNRNISHNIFPSSTRRYNARVGTIPSEFLHIRVPIDDTETMTYYVESKFKDEGPFARECRGYEMHERGVYQRVEDGWWRLASAEQDRAAQESQGLIHDRTREQLGTSDRGILMWRKLAFDSIKAVQEGRDPHGIVRDGGDEIIRFDAGKNFSDADKMPVTAGAN